MEAFGFGEECERTRCGEREIQVAKMAVSMVWNGMRVCREPLGSETETEGLGCRVYSLKRKTQLIRHCKIERWLVWGELRTSMVMLRRWGVIWLAVGRPSLF